MSTETGSSLQPDPPLRIATPVGAGMSKRILVVEDQEDNRRILRDMLTSADYEIVEADVLQRFGAGGP
jgi:PleD family two-component response regulator